MNLDLSKIRYLNIRNVGSTILMIWVIMLSGVWTVRLSDIAAFYAEVVTAFCFLIIMVRKGYKLRGKRVSLFLIFLLLFEMIFHREIELWSTYLSLMCCIVFGLFFVNVWGEEKTAYYYKKILFGITILSLVGYALKNPLLSVSSGFPRIVAQSATYINYYFYLYCIESPNRNPGIFWEPGAFAVFIGIALFFELRDTKKTSFYKVVIYWIALVSTGSTLAYTVLFITVLMYVLNTSSVKSFGIKIVTVLLGGISSFSALIELGIFTNIQSKLLAGLTVDPSSRVRTIGQMMDWNVFLSHPIFGAGYSGYLDISDTLGGFFRGEYVLSANTFTYSLALFGIVFEIVLIISLVKLGYIKGKEMASIVSCILIIWLFVTQSFINKPIFYILVIMGASRMNYLKEEGELL